MVGSVWARAPRRSPLAALLCVGLVAGAAVGFAVGRSSSSQDAGEIAALRGEVARLNETVGNLSAALAQARADAELGQVAANQAAVTEVSYRLGEVSRLLEAGERSEAFEPLSALIAAAGNSSWAALLEGPGEAVRAAGAALYDRMSFGTAAEWNGSLRVLVAAVDELEDIFYGLYLPYHGASPAGPVVELDANLSGFYEEDGAGGRVRNPTLRLSAGATVLVQVTNRDAVDHEFEVPSLLAETRMIKPGETVGIVLGPAMAGDYRYFCDISGHETTMNGHLIVAA